MDDDKEIETKLRQYPSSFDLYEEIQSMSKDCVEKHLERLVKEVESNPYDNTMEKLRAWNFISFLSFILGNEKDAFEYNSKVLERSKDNIMGLCNKALFLLKMQEKYHVVHDLCKQLNESRKHKGNMLFAKAEKAFHYLCLGTKRNEKSRHLFKEVLDEVHELNIDGACETDDSEDILLQTDNYCVLNFSYALTYKRALNLSNCHDVSSFDVSSQLDMIKKACNIYGRIIHIEGDSTCLKYYKGRSYVELGSIDFDIRKNKSTFQNVNSIKDVLPDREDLWLSTNEFYEKAECFCPNDVFVLERCGKYFRYVNVIDKSISLLERAIAIRGTSFSHHHLALSLKRQVESHFRQPKSEKYLTLNVPDNTDACGMLKHTSLDETVSLASNMSIDDYDKEIHMKPKQENASANSDDGNLSLRGRHSENQHDLGNRVNFPFKKETIRGPSIENFRGFGSRGDVLLKGEAMRGPHTEHQLRWGNRGIAPFKGEFMRTRHSKNHQGWGSRGTVPFKRETIRGPSIENFRGLGSRGDVLLKGEAMRGPHTEHQLRWGNRGIAPFKGEFMRTRHSKNHQGWGSRGTVPFKRETIRGRPTDNLRCWGNRGNAPFKGEIMRTRHSENHQGWGSINRNKAHFGIKCPVKPKLINKEKHIDTIKQIIFHFDKSFELSSNYGAIYDKGLLYRQIEEHDNALATFKILIRDKGGHCSLVQLSNAYEQAGLCLNGMLWQSEEKGELDMKTYFKKSIEISCSIVSKLPFLQNCWVSAPTLKEFLSGKAKTTEHLKDLVYLSEKFENYGEAIKFLKDRKELTVDENERAKLEIQLVENYLSNGNYEDAVFALGAMVCLPNGYELIDEKMYLQAYIEGGVVALKQESFKVAGLRLRNALDFYRHNQNVHNRRGHNNTDIEDENFDVFILCNEDLEEKSMSLVHILTAFKLRVTINFQELLPGTSKMSGIYQQFRHSHHFLLVIDEKQLENINKHYFEQIEEVILERNYGHIVIIKTSKDAKVPSNLSKYPSMEMNIEADEIPENCYENESLCETIKALLLKLASSKQRA
ncbi:uncharacterized protein LOC132742960 [Ruditapes philippinarum]|uniref:uncharacterized protein LOC132742960 n=1 Tax=Ruditapes philippinarum TaxID=129788 RepID=UPI00295B3B77|nr:uncharacterized protein LOC132742960 [Ruditapes philippinarum]